jgi:hypothetical protein
MVTKSIVQGAQWWCIAALYILSALPLTVQAQNPEPTPGIVNLSPLLPSPASTAAGIASPTPPPTQVSLVRIEARDFANVRAEPSTDATQLGQIRAGETYTAIARYVAWIQFQFPNSPTGRGWVFGELVRVTGDLNSLPEVNPFVVPTSDPALVGLGQSAGVLQISTAVTSPLVGADGNPARLPTFTYPPGIASMPPTQTSQDDRIAGEAVTGNVPTDTPPIVPILILGGIGLAGLALGAFRRG